MKTKASNEKLQKKVKDDLSSLVLQRNSFQVVVATDGCLTFALFNYNGSIAWGGDQTSSVGMAVISASDGVNTVFSRAPDEVRAGQTRRYLISLAPSCSGRRRKLQVCLQLVSLAQRSNVGTCPRNIFTVRLDGRFRLEHTNGNRECYVNTFPRSTNVVSCVRIRL